MTSKPQKNKKMGTRNSTLSSMPGCFSRERRLLPLLPLVGLFVLPSMLLNDIIACIHRHLRLIEFIIKATNAATNHAHIVNTDTALKFSGKFPTLDTTTATKLRSITVHNRLRNIGFLYIWLMKAFSFDANSANVKKIKRTSEIVISIRYSAPSGLLKIVHG